MSTLTQPKLIFGGAAIDSRYGFDDLDKLQKFLRTISESGIDTIDTAFIYGDSEDLLGRSNAASRFVIDTKFPGGFSDEPATKDEVVQAATRSLRRLKTGRVGIFYQHAPEPKTPLVDTLSGVNELYKSGVFERFGLSNFTAQDVEEVVRICREHGFVSPTVYQGNYSAFARRTETELFPVLRRHRLAFYAYSPSAGGFLAKTSAMLRNGGTGRWAMENSYGKIYNGLYSKAPLFDGLDLWNDAAREEGISGVEMAYRWISAHSKLDGALGDAVIVGARSERQLQEIVTWIAKGPLSQEAAFKIDTIWDKIASDAPLDNYNSFLGVEAKA